MHKKRWQPGSNTAGVLRRRVALVVPRIDPSEVEAPTMSDDLNHSRQNCKSDCPEFYHRIMRTAIAQELKASFELSKDLPHRMVVLLMQLGESSK